MPGAATQGPIIIQGQGAGGAAKKTEPAKIIIKQTVKQVQNQDTKQRKKKVTKANRGALQQKRKEYANAKKAVKKALLASKKGQYTRDNEAIKKLKRGERVAARKALKAKLKTRYTDLLKQLPKTGRLDYNALSALINKIKALKW